MNTVATSRELLTIKQAANRLSCSEATVRRLVKSGEIPACRLGRLPRKAIRIDAYELARWLYSSDGPVHFGGEAA